MEFFLILLLLALYFLPIIVASSRNHRSTTAIFVLNLVAGWTLLGWVVALVWAFTNPEKMVVQSARGNSESGRPSVADEIQKLADLKEKGLLTDDEFDKRKRHILERT